MKDETKKNIKETFEDILLVVVCIILVGSMNKSCSNMIQKTTKSNNDTTMVRANILQKTR